MSVSIWQVCWEWVMMGVQWHAFDVLLWMLNTRFAWNDQWEKGNGNVICPRGLYGHTFHTFMSCSQPIESFIYWYGYGQKCTYNYDHQLLIHVVILLTFHVAILLCLLCSPKLLSKHTLEESRWRGLVVHYIPLSPRVVHSGIINITTGHVVSYVHVDGMAYSRSRPSVFSRLTA